MYRVVKEYVAYFNRARPHQRLGQRIPERASGSDEGKGEGEGRDQPVLGRVGAIHRQIDLVIQCNLPVHPAEFSSIGCR